MMLRELFERNVDPIKLAQRAGQQFGKTKDYGYDDSNTLPGKYIPLKSFDDDLVDEMEEARHTLYKAMGYQYSANNLRSIRNKLESNFGTTKTVNIKQLVATQPFVRIEDVDTLKQKVSTSKEIAVTKYRNKLFIADGHHATLAARLRGDQTVVAKVVDLDKAIAKIQGKQNENQ